MLATHTASLWWLLLAAAGLTAGGCGGGTATSVDAPIMNDGPVEPLTYKTCPPEKKTGGIRIELGDSFTAISGSIALGVVPGDVRQLLHEADGCRLVRKRNLLCQPGCASGQTCGDDGQCIPYPDNVSAGVITISGLARAVRMVPSPVGQQYWDTTLPHPGFLSGADIRLQASGGEAEAFSLRGWGVDPLVIPPQPLDLQAGQPFVMTWQPGPAGPARVRLTVNVDQHGVTPATLICEAEDTGTLTVPSELVTALLEAGASGYPRALVARQTVDAASLAQGCVELVVAAPVERSLTVAGHHPCQTDTDCPPGRTCQTQIKTCRAAPPTPQPSTRERDRPDLLTIIQLPFK